MDSGNNSKVIKEKVRKIISVFNIDLNLEYEKYSIKYIFKLNIGTH